MSWLLEVMLFELVVVSSRVAARCFRIAVRFGLLRRQIHWRWSFYRLLIQKRIRQRLLPSRCGTRHLLPLEGGCHGLPAVARHAVDEKLEQLLASGILS